MGLLVQHIRITFEREDKSEKVDIERVRRRSNLHVSSCILCHRSTSFTAEGVLDATCRVLIARFLIAELHDPLKLDTVARVEAV